VKQFCLHPGQENLRDGIESKFCARTLHPAAPAFRLLPATWTACAAQVEVNPASGEFKVNKLSLAMDLGTVVNPDGVRAQIEGSALCGMSLATSTSALQQRGAAPFLLGGWTAPAGRI